MSRRSIILRLGDEVSARRLRLGLTQEQLAHRAGLNTNTVGRLERGERPGLQVTTVYAVAANLDTSMADLFAGADSRA